MAVSVVSDSNFQLNDGFSTSISFSYDATGSNALIALGETDLSRTWSSATYNGTSMTELWDYATLDGTGFTLGCYMMVSPSSGSNTLTVNFSGACGAAVNAVGLSGVETGSGVGGAHRTVYNNRAASGTSATVTVVDSESGDLVIGNCVTLGATIAADGSQTTLSETQEPFGGGTGSGDTSTKSASGASTQLIWTVPDNYWATGATALIASGGGGGASVGTFVTGDLSGIGSPGRFFKDVLQ